MDVNFSECVCILNCRTCLTALKITTRLKDSSLFHEKAYINGQWVDAKSGASFEVVGTSARSNACGYF